MKVLIVDDEPDLLLLVRLQLELTGHNVMEASDGREALDRLDAEPPELMLLDLRMPRLSGWEVLEALRRDGRIERLPVIVLSAHADPSSAKRAFEMGCRGYLQKPFSEDALLDEVQRVMTAAPGFGTQSSAGTTRP